MAIKLGGGGGSASQIDEVVFLKNEAATVTLADGSSPRIRRVRWL